MTKAAAHRPMDERDSTAAAGTRSAVSTDPDPTREGLPWESARPEFFWLNDYFFFRSKLIPVLKLKNLW